MSEKTLEKFNEKFSVVYTTLYENDFLENLLENSGVYDEILETAERYLKSKNWWKFMTSYYKKYHNVFTSDRELVAMALAKNLYKNDKYDFYFLKN